MRSLSTILALGVSLISLCGACRAPVPPAAARPVVTTADSDPDVPKSLRDARAQAAKLERLAPPVYAGTGEKSESLSWISGPFTRWYDESLQIHLEAERAFSEASLVVHGAHEKLEVIFEAFRMSTMLHDRFVAAGRSAMPRAWATDADLRAAFETALMQPITKLLRPVAELCAERAEALQDDSESARACKARLAVMGPTPTPTPSDLR